jgi:anti-anti-sigma regulatory factor
MFKISIIDTRAQRKLVVEGKLSDPWVSEFYATWKNANRDLNGRKLLIDLSSVTVISRAGEDAIFNMMKEGAKFSCGSICTRYLLKRLARKCDGNLRSATQRTHIATEASSRR